MPFNIHGGDMTTTNTLQELLPRQSRALAGFTELTESFGYGTADPSRLLIVAPGTDSIYTDKGFGVVQQLIETILSDPAIKQTAPADFASVAFAGVRTSVGFTSLLSIDAPKPLLQGFAINASVVQICSAVPTIDPRCPTLLYLKAAYLSEDERAIWVEFKSKFDPYSNSGATWIKTVRIIMKGQAERTGFGYYISGGGPTFADLMDGCAHGLLARIGGLC